MQPKFFIFLLLVMIFITYILGRCTQNNRPETDMFMEKYFTFFQNNEYNKCSEMIADDFFEKLESKNRETWEQDKINEVNTNGQLLEWKLDSWTTHIQNNGGKEGKYFVLNYSLVYEKIQGIESYVLFQTKGSQDIKIMSISKSAK